MRWQPITICLLCALWMPIALWAADYEPRWKYELEAYAPLYPWSIAVPLALAQSAAGVLPFALVYFCYRMKPVSSHDRLGFYLKIAAYVLTTLVDLAALAYVFLAPSIVSALVR